MSSFENSPDKKERNDRGWCGSFEGLVPREDLRIEDEVRVIDIDTDLLIEQVLERGGGHVFNGHILDERFDLKQVNIAEAFGSPIRIRTFTEHTGEQTFEVTLKGFRANDKDEEEVVEYNKRYTTYDEAYRAMCMLLKKRFDFDESELFVSKTSMKDRISLRLGSVCIDIDNPIMHTVDGEENDIEYLPQFAEFEVLWPLDTPEEEQEALKKERSDLIKSLGYEPASEEYQYGLKEMIDAYNACEK
ncbi:MAG: hypothetical protein ACJKTH_02970 [Patescibacteria group bacterium UBA2163]